MSGLTLFRIASLYAIPALAALTVILVFCLLLLRIRRGQLDKRVAWWRFAATFLVPVLAVALLGLVSELGSYGLLGDDYVFDADAALQTLGSLLPIGLYLAALVSALLLVFPLAARLVGRT